MKCKQSLSSVEEYVRVRPLDLSDSENVLFYVFEFNVSTGIFEEYQIQKSNDGGFYLFRYETNYGDGVCLDMFWKKKVFDRFIGSVQAIVCDWPDFVENDGKDLVSFCRVESPLTNLNVCVYGFDPVNYERFKRLLRSYFRTGYSDSLFVVLWRRFLFNRTWFK